MLYLIMQNFNPMVGDEIVWKAHKVGDIYRGDSQATGAEQADPVAG